MSKEFLKPVVFNVLLVLASIWPAFSFGQGNTYIEGAPGSITRTISSKLQEDVSVLDFGADPTGVSDSTAAIQNALNAVPNGRVHFPSQANGQPATYKISGIHVLRTQRLAGGEASSSRLSCTSPSAPCVVLADDVGGLSYAHGGIDNLFIDGPGVVGGGIGLYIGGDPTGVATGAGNYGDFLTFNRLKVSNFSVGVQFGNNAYEDQFNSALILNNGTGVLFPKGLSNFGEMITFLGGSISDNKIGFENDSATEVSLHGVAVDYNGVGVSGTNVWLYAFGCHFEQSGGTLISIGGGTRVVLDGNTYLLTGFSGSDTQMISFSNSYVIGEIAGGDAYSNHPVAYFVNAPNPLSFDLHIGPGINIATYAKIGAVISPASAPGLTTEINGTMTLTNLVVAGTCTGCSSTEVKSSSTSSVDNAASTQLKVSIALPTCDAARRGTFFFGGSGENDHLSVCAQIGSGLAWKSVF